MKVKWLKAGLALAMVAVLVWSGSGSGIRAGSDAGMSRTLSGSLPYDLYPLWDFSNGNKLSAPVAANGMVYFGDEQGTMYAVDAETGEIQWTFQAHGRIRQPAAVTLGAVYFAAGDLVSGKLYALDPWDGSFLWSHDFTGSMVGAPVAQHPRVYFGFNSQTGNVVSLSVFDGGKEWSVQAAHYLSGQLAVREDVVLYGTTLNHENESFLYCIDSSAGSLTWQKPLSGYFSGVSLLQDNRAVVTSAGASAGRIYALDVRTGEEMWNPFRVRSFNFWSPPSVHGDNIYSLNKGVVYALELNTGEELWARPLPVHDEEGPMPFSHAPLSCEEQLYITYAYADSRLSQLHVLDRHRGSLLAVHRTGTDLIAPPIVRGRNLYLTGQEGRLEARRGLKILVNGRAIIPAESGAFIQGGTGHVALRPLLEIAGYTVTWEGQSRSVIAQKGERMLTLEVDNQRGVLNSEDEVHLQLQLVNDRLMVPVRALVEFMGGQVQWDADSMSITCQLP